MVSLLLHINTAINNLDIIVHRPIFYLNQDVSETGETGTSSLDWAQVSRYHLKTATQSILRRQGLALLNGSN
jgi:hypothetical protein